uniref:Teneurin-like YD-shell domain-containing protein n=1 Tax=Eptatretus burgeri TaxID=7764 RepID=A0A8C4QIL1_EPTBU
MLLNNFLLLQCLMELATLLALTAPLFITAMNIMVQGERLLCCRTTATMVASCRLNTWEQDGVVLYHYGMHGHLTEVLFDGTRASFTYDEHSGLLHMAAIATDRSNQRQSAKKGSHEGMPESICSIKFKHTGPLLEQQMSSCVGIGGAVALFEYSHDERFRMTGLQTVVDEQPLPIDLFRYDDVTGRLEQFGKFGVIYYGIDPVVTTSSMTLTKRRDNLGRITEVHYEILRSLLFWLTIRYDVAGRVVQRHFRIDPTANTTALEYEYDPDGQLQAVAVDGRPTWRYSYDLNGNLHLLSPGASSHLAPLRYTSGDRLSSLGDLPYDVDADGFLCGRGNERFEYDSRGVLVRAWGGGGSTEAWSITYGYDAFGRRAWRKDQRGGFLQFFYADMSRPTRLTHVYNHTNREITAYYYDLQVKGSALTTNLQLTLFQHLQLTTLPILCLIARGCGA